MAWVFDASISIAWAFDDEKTPETEALLDRLRQEDAFVPALWHLEIANLLSQAIRKKARITLTQRTQFLSMLAGEKINIDPLTHVQAWNATLALADSHKLSTYDAAYLELAIRMGVELATLDKDLRLAAAKAGVTVIP